ncbi:multiple C2 and transmembrane domain-containing protein-like [Cydia amplana]|uniref:multiple C2 and transmembrane domain-containing protein-like n=1 Tax=Cydia amplana TaxID=1869771 RepID=UPI002FE5FF6B
MSTKKHSPQTKRSEALSGRLSKSASELSCASPAPRTPPPRARSAHHHAPLSVVHRTQHFFTNLKSRWQRSRSRERCPAGTAFSLAPGQDSSGTEYAGDGSSEHSTPANSPRRRKTERCPAGTAFSLAPGQDSSGTEYAGDGSSEHSTLANSPRGRKTGQCRLERERCPAGTASSLAPGPDSSGTEYAGDGSSEHITPANSPSTAST